VIRLALLCVLLAGPLAAQPAPDSLVADSLALHRWTRADSEGPGFGGLPVRSVRDVAAFLPGVSADPETSGLVVRARPGVAPPDVSGVFDAARVGQGPVYVIDGVRVVGEPVVPFEAVEEVEVLTGFVPARFGEAGAGLVLVETREGGDRYGARAEGITSTDGFGYTLGAFSVEGPIGNARLGRFAFSGEARSLSDATPYGIDTYRLSDEAYADLAASPQVVRVGSGPGGAQYVPFPVEAAQAALAAGQPFTDDDVRAALGLPNDAEVSGPINAAQTYTADRFERVGAKDDGLRDLALHGNATLHVAPTVRLRLGGTYGREHYDQTAAPAERYASLLYNRDRLYEAERSAGRYVTSLRHQLTAAASYDLQASYQQWRAVQYPQGFSDDPADALFYGDIDADFNAVARRYFVRLQDTYESLYAADGGARPDRAAGTFFLPGRPATIYRKQEGSAFRLSGDASVRLGEHAVTFGGAFERQTHRRFDLAGGALARYFADGNVESGGEGVTTYDALPFEAVVTQTLTRYGYNYLGTETVDSEDVSRYFEGTSTDIAPYRPTYAAGYVQDRFVWQALALDLGLRVEAFGSDATVPIDLFAPFPIVRAGSLDARPSGIGSDYAVYFDDVGEVVGYRDLDGRFFDAGGVEATADEIRGRLSGQVEQTGAPLSTAFETAPTHLVWQPRVGIRYAVSERTSLRAYYSRTAQRASAALYAPFSEYEVVTGQSTVGNAALRPEVTDDFGAGVRVQPAEPLQFEVTAFYRRYSDVIALRTLSGGFPSYGTYRNVDAVSSYGADLAVTLARTQGFAFRGNYTLAFANGTGSDAALTNSIVTQGAFSRDVTSPADYDTRHTLDLVLDYRFDDGMGPNVGGVSLLGGLGFGAAFSARSGRPYTALSASGFGVNDTFTSPISGDLNGARLPWTRRLDLRVDKQFGVGLGTVTAFLWVENVLGTENVLAVYRATGEPGDDGYLDTPGGASYVANSPDPDGGAFNYLAYVGGPANIGGAQSTSAPLFYGSPRRVRLGVRLAL
jgi:hypothetical protein